MTAIALIGRVDPLASIRREHHLITGMDKLSNGTVKAETVDISSSECEHHLHRGTVRHVTSTDTIGSRTKKVINSSSTARLLLVHSEDGSNTYVTVDIRTAVLKF
jgi:hypothetical protein